MALLDMLRKNRLDNLNQAQFTPEPRYQAGTPEFADHELATNPYLQHLSTEEKDATRKAHLERWDDIAYLATKPPRNDDDI